MKTRRHFILLVLSMKFNEVQQYEEKCTYIPWYTYEKFISRHLEMHLFKLIKFEPLSLTKYACTKVISIYSTSFPWWHRMLGWHFKISCYSAAWANLFIFFFLNILMVLHHELSLATSRWKLTSQIHPINWPLLMGPLIS